MNVYNLRLLHFFLSLSTLFIYSPIIVKINIVAELWRAKRACGAPWGSKSTHRRKCGNHVTVHRPQPARPQENQCSISDFLASLVAQED